MVWPDNPALSIPLLHASPDALPKDELVTSMWTEHALYWCQPDKKQVTVLVHCDQSCIILKDNGFFYHYLEPLSEESLATLNNTSTVDSDTSSADSAFVHLDDLHHHGSGLRKKVYAIDAVPAMHNASGLNPGEMQYELRSITDLALRLQQHAMGVLEAKALEKGESHRRWRDLHRLEPDIELTDDELAALRATKPPNTDARQEVKKSVFSAEVHEQCMVRGVGEFTAFKDGRVKSVTHASAQIAIHVLSCSCHCPTPIKHLIYFCSASLCVDVPLLPWPVSDAVSLIVAWSN